MDLVRKYKGLESQNCCVIRASHTHNTHSGMYNAMGQGLWLSSYSNWHVYINGCLRLRAWSEDSRAPVSVR